MSQISDLSLQDYEELERQRMERNAWDITHQLVDRLDDAPVLLDFIRRFPSQKSEDLFFVDQNRIKRYTDAAQGIKQSLPGSSYYKKMFDFIDDRYDIGELNMEYKRELCVEKKGDICSFCRDTNWTGPEMNRIPRPWPDYTKLPECHYKHVEETPLITESDQQRAPDDFQPRANLKMAFENNTVSLNDMESIEDFCNKYGVTEKVVKEHLEHLQTLKRLRDMRSSERQRGKLERQNKSYDDYNWVKLVEDGEIGKLLVPELHKYIEHHNLPITGKKRDKIRRIITSVYTNQERDIPEREYEYTSEDGESESEDEIEDNQYNWQWKWQWPWSGRGSNKHWHYWNVYSFRKAF